MSAQTTSSDDLGIWHFSPYSSPSTWGWSWVVELLLCSPEKATEAVLVPLAATRHGVDVSSLKLLQSLFPDQSLQASRPQGCTEWSFLFPAICIICIYCCCNFIWCFHLSGVQHDEKLLQVFGGRYTSVCFCHFESSALFPSASVEKPFPITHSFGTPWTTSLRCEKWPFTPIFNELLILGGLFHFPHTILELEKSEEKSHWWIHDKFLLKTFLMLLQQLLKYIPKKVSPQHTTVPGDDISCLPSFSISCSCRCLQWLFLSPWDVSHSMPSVYARWGQSSALSSEERKVA